MAQLYRQSDPRWARKIVGFGSGVYQSFQYVGCVVTALTYLLNSTFGYNHTPDQVNDKLKAVRAFTGAAILWARVPLAFPELKWYWRDYNWNPLVNVAVRIWILINPKVPVLAEVYEPASITKKHWVLMLGNQKFYNSINGRIQPTSDYKNYTGAARFGRA